MDANGFGALARAIRKSPQAWGGARQVVTQAAEAAAP